MLRARVAGRLQVWAENTVITLFLEVEETSSQRKSLKSQKNKTETEHYQGDIIR